VTVYVIDALGVEMTDAPVIAEISVLGDQEYVEAPLATKVTDWPRFKVAELGETLTVTAAETVAVTASLLTLSTLFTV
jgi:hypothetical protein